MQTHTILGGKVQLFKRGQVWFARASVNKQQIKKSTGSDSLSLAQQVAEDWYLGLRGKSRAGLPLKEVREATFNDMADLFEVEYEIITEGERSPKWVAGHKARLRLHLRPFFGKMGISQITSGDIQNYRVHRAQQHGRLPAKDGEGAYVKALKPPSRSTLHDEIGTLSLVLQTAVRHGKLGAIPMLSPPYKKQRKVIHRPWFTGEEYKQLYKATAAAAKAAPEAYRWNYEQLHDQVLFLGNTGLRPDEASRLQHRDVTIAVDPDTGEEILDIEVRGKTGYGPCKSMPGAVEPYRRLLARAKPMKLGRKVERERLERRGQAVPIIPEYPKRTDLLFPSNHTDLFNDILKVHDLKEDREGQPRVLYSLRHTYICLRLLDGADIYNLAKNCRTSVEMIEKNYAIHLKHMIDASAINRRKSKPKLKARRQRVKTPDADGDE
ncbi:site-specific integrase [Asticcacaulis sp.]|uniref:site-specific integrase n=1 Tax=Asticcacaulis sp. TaxID=1872648 RepID=UPI00391C32A7